MEKWGGVSAKEGGVGLTRGHKGALSIKKLWMEVANLIETRKTKTKKKGAKAPLAFHTISRIGMGTSLRNASRWKSSLY